MQILNYSGDYVQEWFPGHGYFCNWLTADQADDAVFYTPWAERKDKIKSEILKKGIKGITVGYGDSYYNSRIIEPLTFDFSSDAAEPAHLPGTFPHIDGLSVRTLEYLQRDP